MQMNQYNLDLDIRMFGYQYLLGLCYSTGILALGGVPESMSPL